MTLGRGNRRRFSSASFPATKPSRPPKRLDKVKSFGNKRFELEKVFTRKSEAKKFADFQRKRGFRARVFEVNDQFGVYLRFA